MIEREAGTPPDETGKVARAIENRLEKDAAARHRRDDPLRAQPDQGRPDEVRSRNRTGRTTPGPGPACRRRRSPLPSAASLQAAIQPPEGPWLYYVLVSNDPPTHMFTDSYQGVPRGEEHRRRTRGSSERAGGEPRPVSVVDAGRRCDRRPGAPLAVAGDPSGRASRRRASTGCSWPSRSRPVRARRRSRRCGRSASTGCR